MAGFPSQLFLTLVGVTLLFTLAQANGTLDRLAHHAVRGCRGHRGVLPIMFFVLAAALASIGPGNIATAALVAPMAMATAGAGRHPAVSHGHHGRQRRQRRLAVALRADRHHRQRTDGPDTACPATKPRPTSTTSLAHAAVAFGGYFLFGGLKLFGTGARDRPCSRRRTLRTPNAEPENPSSDRRHILTLGGHRRAHPQRVVLEVNVGMGAFLAAVVLVLSGAADDKEAIKRMPWNVIIMVGGVTVLIAVLEKAQGIDLLVSLVAQVSRRAAPSPRSWRS